MEVFSWKRKKKQEEKFSNTFRKIFGTWVGKYHGRDNHQRSSGIAQQSWGEPKGEGASIARCQGWWNARTRYVGVPVYKQEIPWCDLEKETEWLTL